MKSDFKVLEWLRDVRDRQAAETDGMSAKARFEHDRRMARDAVRAFLKKHPEARRAAGQRLHSVAEDPGEYGSG
ncbi:MAG: hypothetical protein KJ626_13625 [Verrucomicrobia bacterium]|nr:hypothetical protein [Verrucomicrobiota bacterium]MBU1693353.1 hypothetical protein [Verrucomicrobiota bacterium]